ncbi:hypothetical protein ROA7450_03279 [Roseovarius albus]|uniref:Mitochondrial inner membrane protein n=1 Tax=Roseovarius albus TaxID=1247867 RepID=A0A1X6ZVE2_9RHOB|nr:hypothetical protein [Roseovarius albus]SLN62921.1 hypothetical protein ROA7450_03279 [Roseovarius albus]
MAKTPKSRKAAKPKKATAKPEEADVEASAKQETTDNSTDQSQETEVQASEDAVEKISEPKDQPEETPTGEVPEDQPKDVDTESETSDVNEADVETNGGDEAFEGVDTEVTTEDSIALEESEALEPVLSEASAPEPVSVGEPPENEPRKSGFFPAVFGGVIAAGIGFAASLYLFPDWGRSDQVADDRVPQLEALIAKHSEAIDALQKKGADTVMPDLSGLQTAHDELGASVSGLVKRLEQVETNLEGLASLASGSGADADALMALQDQMTQQRTEIEAMLGQAQGMEAEAKLAAQRAALGQIQIAMDTGAAFSTPVSELSAAGVAVPKDLSQFSGDGVKSLAELQESFPELAREALRIARSTAGEDNGSKGVGALLRSALGARSLEPQEGDSADAVLSRAEAALREERLHDVLSELQALPEPALVILTDWSGDVAQRLAAISALQTLNENLN